MTEQAQLFNYDQATETAWEVIRAIEGHFDRLEICGGLRREKKEVHDIDLVCLSHDIFSLNIALCQVCSATNSSPEKIKFVCKGIPGEIYIVQSEQQFEVMKLERTGDFQFTRTLAQNAITKGMVFRFSKDKGYYKIPMYGLYRITGTWWAPDDDRSNRKQYLIGDMINPVAWREKDIIELIFSKYYEPEERSWWDSGYDPDAYGGRGG